MSSDKGSTNGEKKSDRRDDVCRDFLNNICNRGSRCKFYHPPDEEKKHKPTGEEPYNFCLDFQNQGCFREHCKFIHANADDVERYKKTGDVNLPLARAIAAVIRSDKINDIPICNEYNSKGICSHERCRYWHINAEEERRRRLEQMGARRSGASGSYRAGARRPANDAYDPYDCGMPRAKSRYAPAGLMPEPAQSSRYVIELERRNSELLARVDGLERDLRHEKDRYEDLLTLFKQTQAAVQTGQISRIAPVPPPAASAQLHQHQAWALNGDKYSDWMR
ncbi:zinc finger CCCH domain-containing protein 10 [Ditylenchus destructor]|uniref:Zinc finger CCCH domain-containing protein 10 n=1 Tax=Ditylenchus destructor TaxID=166010 RepID=A0AAD4N877_9BILA|nr:zinc finger CCCH domain-containing protein 10 [Ditylenchus destructor]